MKRIIFSLFLVTAMLVGSFSLAAAQEKEPTVDVIIQVEESAKKDVADAVKEKGGEVRFEYSNVSALAVTISTGDLASITNLAGVTLVEKDRIFNLTDELNGEKNDGQPMFFEVESMAGVNVAAIDAASIDAAAIPDGYANFLYTGASSVWEETGYGEGTIVAVVDTGYSAQYLSQPCCYRRPPVFRMVTMHPVMASLQPAHPITGMVLMLAGQLLHPVH